jgi:hypothetical protein
MLSQCESLALYQSSISASFHCGPYSIAYDRSAANSSAIAGATVESLARSAISISSIAAKLAMIFTFSGLWP